MNEVTREDLEERYKWRVSDLYESDDTWRLEKSRMEKELKKLEGYRGRLGDSATTLAEVLELTFAIDKEISRLWIYAHLLHDEDTRIPFRQGMSREMMGLGSEFGAASAFLRPEILGLGEEMIRGFISTEPRLADYQSFLEDSIRWMSHTLSEQEEKLLALAAPMAGSPRDIFDVFANADFPWPVVTLTDGTSVTVTAALYTDLRTSSIREDRERVMSAFMGQLSRYGATLGTMLDGSLRKAIFFARARGFSSTLEAALFNANIPVTVYTRLIEGANRHLPTLHRYLDLRRRMLGVDRLHYHDLYAPLVSSASERYTPEQAREMIISAMAPLGQGYQEVLKEAFDNRWIDWYPTPGKRSGAYSNGAAYDVHPYILLNYTGDYNAVSTVAHELGHALHSHYATEKQPYPTASYPIFVAEVASTFNEVLLLDHMLATDPDVNLRLALLGDYLETMRSTLFRQVQFAEFEMQIHEMAERGEPITGDSLSRIYLENTRKYYGHDEGITVVDESIAHEWSYVSHFYREFYVYQYATSLSASVTLAGKAREQEPGIINRYFDLLGAGDSEYPIDSLRKAGVDMTTDEPLEWAMREMNRVIDEIEGLLGEDRQA
ncbi:MAG: oligoendopeptidase F [Gemmatimonadota bacterium]|jgi:oligoendopeptidase F|nr:oligoendopeptidase F [Gemmatimonadota bacterium]